MTGYFADINGSRYKVTIGNETGTLTMGSDPVHIVWEQQDHLFVGLRSASCQIRILTNTDLSSLYTDNPLGTVVKVETLDAEDDVDTCCFFGYLVPQEWDAPYSGLNDEVELMAVDALAALKNIRYTAVNGRYPQGLTTQSILNRGCQIAGIATVPTLPSAAYGTINEQAFLPRYEDVSEYNAERQTWWEVLEAIAVWNGVCFMHNVVDATELLAVDVIDTVENGTAETVDVRGDDSAGSDIRVSIEPAKSRVAVSYANLSPMPLLPEIVSDRLTGNKLSEVSVVDSPKRTITRYYVAKDWASQGVRAGCGAIVNLIDNQNDVNDEKVCIVGPAYLGRTYYNTREPFLDAKAIAIEFAAWARNDMEADDNGYEKLSIETKDSNFDPTINIYVNDPILGSFSVNRTLELNGKEGFVDCKIYLSAWFTTAVDPHFTGNVCMTIPAHCVITDLNVSIWNGTNQPLSSGIKDLDKVENDGIVELKTAGWNDSIDIKARLRSVEVPYSAADVITTWNKFPYCKTEQFAEPRKRVRATIDELWSALTVVKDAALSPKKMVIDASDMDLKKGCSTVVLKESWEDGED